MGWKNGWNAFVCISLSLESRSQNTLEKQYLFCQPDLNLFKKNMECIRQGGEHSLPAVLFTHTLP